MIHHDEYKMTVKWYSAGVQSLFRVETECFSDLALVREQGATYFRAAILLSYVGRGCIAVSMFRPTPTVRGDWCLTP